MTLFLKNTTTDLTQSNNGSSNTIYHSIWGRDKNNNSWFCVEGYTNSSGSVAAFLGVRNYNTEGVAQSWKGFTITEDKSNNLTYTVSDPHAFRSAISTWALVSDSYNTFMPADGTTNGWYKFGTSNTSYGILPSASGGAGSGHNYIGTSTWYWKYSYIDEMYGRNLTISGNNNGISFTGTKATQQMIKFIDANDEWGHGIVIGGGGLTILGSGEAANTLFSNVGATGATETTYISSDNTIEFLATQQNGYDVSAHFTMTDGRFWAGVNGNTTRETSVGAQSGAGQIYMWSHAATSGSRGIYVPAHGTGAAKTVLSVDTNNNVAFYGGQFIGNGKSSSWIKGRDNAIFKVSTISDYSPAISIKTTNGSWEIGTYNYTGYYDDLVFSYCTDTNYNANSNSAVQLKFTEEGHFHSRTIHVHPSTSSYTEGVRIYPYSGWSTIMLGGNDLTAETGTSANSWGLFNNNGSFYITRNGSNTSGAVSFSCVGNVWKIYGNQTNSKSKQQSILHIYGPTYGNTAADMVSGTAGLFSWGDGGPQITFDTSATPGGSQAGALIFTDHDTAATGVSWHFVSNQDDWNVTSKRFHARTNLSIGSNLPNTTHTLYVNGDAQINNQLLISNYSDGRGDAYSGAVQLREYRYQTTSCTYNLYNAPGITFHWGGRWAHKLALYENALYWDSTKVVMNTGTWGISITGNAASASKVGAEATWLYFNNSNEVNFGGTNTSTTIYFGYRATDSRPKPTVFVFGTSTAMAEVKASKVYNAIWNDYAECRKADTVEPGYCVIETSSGIMTKSTKRLQPGCKLTSDTFGTCMGETDNAKTPIAVAGRVLAYPYRDIKEYELGAAVCSAPNGTIDIMSRDEIMIYPERIVGTVSEIPNYEVWYGGNKENSTPIQVNGRIWIYVR